MDACEREYVCESICIWSVDMCACLGLCGCVTAGECIYMWVCECGCECVLGVGVQVPGREGYKCSAVGKCNLFIEVMKENRGDLERKVEVVGKRCSASSNMYGALSFPRPDAMLHRNLLSPTTREVFLLLTHYTDEETEAPKSK